MNEVYVECATEQIPVPLTRKLLFSLLMGLGVMFFLFSMTVSYIFMPIAIAVFAIAYFYHRGNKYQFEYILLNDELHVDRIIANLKRKKAFRGNLVNIELFTDDPQKIEQYKKGSKKIRKKNYSSPRDKVYALVLRNENKFDILYLNADKDLVMGIRRRHPQQVVVGR